MWLLGGDAVNQRPSAYQCIGNKADPSGFSYRKSADGQTRRQAISALAEKDSRKPGGRVVTPGGVEKTS